MQLFLYQCYKQAEKSKKLKISLSHFEFEIEKDKFLGYRI